MPCEEHALDVGLQQKLYSHMQEFAPALHRQGLHCRESGRQGRQRHQGDARAGRAHSCRHSAFKERSGVDKVIILWTANTEKMTSIRAGLNDTAAALLASIERDEKEIAPSTLLPSRQGGMHLHQWKPAKHVRARMHRAAQKRGVHRWR